MAFLSTSARLHLCAFMRSAHQIPRTRSITTGQRTVPSFPAPPPARRNFEPAPSSTKPQHDDTRRAGGAPSRRPTNRQIPFSHVYVLDPTTNKLSPTKHSLEDLIATQQRRIIELVASAPKPIVRVTTRGEVEARYREMRRASRAGAEPKEVQLTWGVASADLEHKMRKARKDLEKGCRVVVAVAIKKRRRPSSRQELVAFADEISEALGGVGQECKEREITERSMILSFRKVDEDVP